MNTSEGMVSVIIPSKNSAGVLGPCVASIREQTYRRYEVIVVDGRSGDESAEISRRAGARVISRPSNMPEARCIGLAAATGEFVLALDADMRLSSNVVEECVNAIRSYADFVVIPEVSEGANIWGRAIAFNRNLSLRAQELGERGIPRFFRRSDLIDIGGWDPRLLWGEDLDVQLRMEAKRGRKGTIGAHLVHSEGSPELHDIYQKWSTYWSTFGLFAEKHPNFRPETLSGIAKREYFTKPGLQSIALHPVVAALGLVVRFVRALAIYRTAARTLRNQRLHGAAGEF